MSTIITGPPFPWDEGRRFQLRCQLDAAFFCLYGIGRDDVDYIMDTFPIVRERDEKQHGEYRSKRVILGVYDAMARAMQAGRPGGGAHAHAPHVSRGRRMGRRMLGPA